MSLCAKCSNLDWNKEDQKFYCREGKNIKKEECTKFMPVK